MPERKIVMKEVRELNSFDGYLLKDVIETLQKSLAKFGEGVEIRELQREHSDSKYLALLKPVPETDSEMAARIDLEERCRIGRESHERSEFERLSKKYGSCHD